MKDKRTPNTDLETIMPILIGAWRRFTKQGGPSDELQTREFREVVECVKKFQTMTDGETSMIGKDYFENRGLLGSYLLYQWVIHYQEGLSLIGELPETPKRVLDVCSGPSPYAFAALRHGANEVFATDQNATALQLGAEVCGRYGLTLNSRKWNCLKDPLPVEGKFDLIILGHCLEELFPSTSKGWPERQQLFIKSLMAKLTPNGYLLITDSSFPDANKRVLQLRDKMVEDGVPVQAPCVWRGECPALKTANSPCFAQREMEKPGLIKQIQRAAEINLSSLKMTYIIFRNPSAGWPGLPTLSELPNAKFYRVISPPIESHYGKRYYLCGTDGKKNLGSHGKEQPKESRAFEYLRRGELIAVEGSQEKPGSMDIIEGTKIKVVAACGKPVEAWE